MTSLWMDRLGGLASATCALHCLLMAFAPALVPLLGLSMLRGEAFEWGFFAFAIGFAVLAGGLGYRVHRTWWVLAGFGAGIAVLVAGRLGEALALFEGGAVLSILGGVVLVGTHAASTLRTRSCQVPCA